MYETKQELDFNKEERTTLDQPRCSLIQMTPRGEKYESGWESNRSEGI